MPGPSYVIPREKKSFFYFTFLLLFNQRFLPPSIAAILETAICSTTTGCVAGRVRMWSDGVQMILNPLEAFNYDHMGAGSI